MILAFEASCFGLFFKCQNLINYKDKPQPLDAKELQNTFTIIFEQSKCELFIYPTLLSTKKEKLGNEEIKKMGKTPQKS